MTNEIVQSIKKTTKNLKNISSLPSKQGIFAFFINGCEDLSIFGKQGQIIYIGMSKKNLSESYFEKHLKAGKTGWSTLRRSIGAILKSKLNLTAQKRDLDSKKLRADKYKYDSIGEDKLTIWMKENLKMGYWITTESLSSEDLNDKKEKVILKLRPTLDLNKKTKQFNPLAKELDRLRAICRNEVKQKNAKN